MTDSLTLNGMILSSMPVGEADRRLLLLTKELGKISCFARGARKPTSPLVGKTRPFSTGKFEIAPGRDSYSLRTAEIREYFEPIVMDPQRSALGSCILELLSRVAQENTDGTELLELGYYALRATEKAKMSPELILTVFEAKTMKLEGSFPEFSTCVKCRKPLENGVFLPSYMNVLCPDCAPEGTGIELSGSALYALRFIGSTDAQHLFSFRLSEETERAVTRVVAVLLAHFLSHPLASEELFRLLVSSEKAEKRSENKADEGIAP